MLRFNTPRTSAAVTVVRTHANPQEVLNALEERRGDDVHVRARRDDSDPVALTLNMYTREQQSLQILAPLCKQKEQCNTSALVPPPSTVDQLIFRCARKTSWAALKQLRADVLSALATANGISSSTTSPSAGSASATYLLGCAQCERLADYMARCFERPRVFDRSWSGPMVLNSTKVAHIVNTLVRLSSCTHDYSAVVTESDEASRKLTTISSSMDQNNISVNPACRAHAVASVVAAFLVPDLVKSKSV